MLAFVARRSLFYMSRVGLGSLGVISEVTLQAVPSHRLLEHTFVSNMQVSFSSRAMQMWFWSCVAKERAADRHSTS